VYHVGRDGSDKRVGIASLRTLIMERYLPKQDGANLCYSIYLPFRYVINIFTIVGVPFQVL
jgi:hypothetical protein